MSTFDVKDCVTIDLPGGDVEVSFIAITSHVDPRSRAQPVLLSAKKPGETYRLLDMLKSLSDERRRGFALKLAIEAAGKRIADNARKAKG